ncbi:hypothetical protein [Scytonema sp. NUACC26]|uniref:hypothetical protein n=1 Tax=Scytonema sp. NUACC26 TaxID=3140176 RepID=UPI0038B25423
MPKYPIPIALLARLAASKDFQGKRIGSGLLKDYLKRVNAAADILGNSLQAIVFNPLKYASTSYFRLRPLHALISVILF